ncbi:hypothetical protein BGZ94_004554 [Podila epigama]|nr:hypothetical protein BGZ94_004554 [Podila epigama]
MDSRSNNDDKDNSQQELDAFLDSSHDDMIANSISQSNASHSSVSGATSPKTGGPEPDPAHDLDFSTLVTQPNPLAFQHPVQKDQPGTSPAIQKRGPSLGLALGGSSFRRKPLFEPDDNDDEESQLDSRSNSRQKATQGKQRKDSGLQDLVRPDDSPDPTQTEMNAKTGQDDAAHGGDSDDNNDNDDEEEEDANSETPLYPPETIRGLESRHDFNFFKTRNHPESRTNSFLSRLGVNAPSINNQGMDNGLRGGVNRMNSPRLGMGPFAPSRLNSRMPGKVFIPRGLTPSSWGPRSDTSTSHSSTQQQHSAGHERGIGHENDEEDGPTSPSNHLSPIYPGGLNPYHDDAVDWVVEGTGMRVAYDDFTTIDWIHDFAQERQRQRKLRHQPGLSGQIAVMYDWIQGWVVVLAVGIAAGIVAGGSDIASQWLGDIKEGYCDTAFYLNRNFCCWGLEDIDACTDWVPWNSATFIVGYVFYIMFALMFATTAAYLVKTCAPYAEGSGIPEVKTILGGFVIRHYLGVETLVIKTVTLVLSTASGLSLGKEGPLLHIACCIGNILPRIFPKFKGNEAKMREILSAAASAGISVAFGAPIGGVVFSLEEMSYYFSSDTMWHSFFCAMAAAVALKLMDPFRTEKLVVFQVQYDRDWHGFEMMFYLMLGILGGLWGAFFIRMNLRLAAFRKTSWLRFFPIYEVFSVCLLTAAVGYVNIFTRVQSPQLLANLFRECDGNAGNYHGLCDEGGVGLRVFSLLSASMVKGGLTILTFGLAIPADVPCVTPGSYAMVGAAAFMGGVTRMTVSLVIIMFELTGALTYVLPIMIVVMISKWVGDAFGKEGIFDGIILLCGYPFLDDKEEYKQNTMASQVMTPVEDIVVVTATGNTLDSLDNLLHETHYKGYPVVNSLRDMMLVGYISRTELRYAIDEARKRNLPGNTPAGNVVPILENTPAFIEFRLWMDQTPITVSHRFPMDQVIVIFRKLGVRYVLCTQHGQLLGLITKKDVLKHLASIEHPDEIELPS